MNVLRAFALAAVLLSFSAAAHTANTSTGSSGRTYCVWPAVGGAFAGVAIAWYGYVGIATAARRNPYGGNSDVSVPAILALETAGLVGGAVAACAIWGNEGRWFPTAGSVITGAVVGGIVTTTAAFALIERSNIDRNTDFPIASGLLIVTSSIVGIVGGGVAGFVIDDALRGPPNALTVTPVLSAEFVGVSTVLRF